MCVVVILIIIIAKNEYSAFEMKAIILTQNSKEMNEHFLLTLALVKQGKYSPSTTSPSVFILFLVLVFIIYIFYVIKYACNCVYDTKELNRIINKITIS